MSCPSFEEKLAWVTKFRLLKKKHTTENSNKTKNMHPKHPH